MALMEQINEGIKDAMRSKNQIRLDTLRMLKSKILAVDARGNVPDPESVKLFKNYLGNLIEALEQNQALNRTESVQKLQLEIAVVQEFLPKALSLEETKQLVAQAIKECSATSKKDLGAVMKATLKLNSAVDAKLAKEVADTLLT
ncbi:MAG TPA: GatB/YqeY domain-containing protein [Parachlamydiaceae bacterium]|nr:GatB/YqeY domain-containing protein [Parachlamydiaceae bacterium]